MELESHTGLICHPSYSCDVNSPSLLASSWDARSTREHYHHERPEHTNLLAGFGKGKIGDSRLTTSPPHMSSSSLSSNYKHS